MIEEIAEAWRINHRVNLLMLDGIDDEGLLCTLSTRGGRSVGRQFAHVHDVRRYQLEVRAKRHAKGLVKFASKDEPDRGALVEALEDSAERVERWLRAAHAGEQGARTQKRGLVPTLGYLIAHESHHRGSIALTLKQCGHALDKDLRYAIWDWNRV